MRKVLRTATHAQHDGSICLLLALKTHTIVVVVDVFLTLSGRYQFHPTRQPALIINKIIQI